MNKRVKIFGVLGYQKQIPAESLGEKAIALNYLVIFFINVKIIIRVISPFMNAFERILTNAHNSFPSPFLPAIFAGRKARYYLGLDVFRFFRRYLFIEWGRYFDII